MARQARHMPLDRLIHGRKGTITKTLTGGLPQYQEWKETSMLLPKGSSGYEKIGTVSRISSRDPKTVWVSTDSPVYWPDFGRTFKKMSRFRAHDETESLAVGDIVHMHSVPRMAEDKAHVVDYVIKPNLEARLRQMIGLPQIPEQLIYYPASKKRPKPPGTTKRSRALKPIKELYLTESQKLLEANIWDGVGLNVRGLLRDQERRANQAQRKMEFLAVKAKTMAEAKAADKALESPGRRPVFRSPSQYPVLSS